VTLADPHAGQRVTRGGVSLPTARIVAILLHGRGASPEAMLELAAEFGVPDVAYLAPAAADRSWYPRSFLAPLDQNEPWLGSALNSINQLVATTVEQGVPRDRIAILGFSQGACLGLEFAARHAQRYAAVVGLSGGVIGPPETPRAYTGSFERTPVFLGCSDVDPHIPRSRVDETADVLSRLGAAVEERIYPGMGHTVNADEILAVRDLLSTSGSFE